MIMSILSIGLVRLVLTIIVLVVLFIILFRFRNKKSNTKDSLDTVQENLDEGEISDAEYEAAKKRPIP